MSDYTQNTLFGPKDSLDSGDPNKLIKGTEFDAEFSEISTAIGTKYDSGDIASNAQAAALTSDVVLVSPVKLKYALENGTFDLADGVTQGGTALTSKYALQATTMTAGDGLTGGGSLAANRSFEVGQGTGIFVSANAVSLSHLGIEELIDPGADRLMFWDDSSNGGVGAVEWLTVGSGLSITAATITADAASIDHDSLSGFVADEHIAHSGVSITAGNGLTGGGTIAASRTVTLGTPGTLTASTTNAVTATSHTHAVGAGVVLAHDTAGGQVTVSVSAPSGGTNGDIWMVV